MAVRSHLDPTILVSVANELTGGYGQDEAVVGSSHLDLGANEPLPIANLHSSPLCCGALAPSMSYQFRRVLSVASRVTGMGADVVAFVFVFQRSGVGRLWGGLRSGLSSLWPMRWY